jgi:hypothetical protein
MMPTLAILLVLAIVPFWGCASSTPPSRASAHSFENVRRVAIVASGESSFTVTEHSAEPGRTFDEVLKWLQVLNWNPYWATLRPLARVVHWGINWLLEVDRAAAAGSHVGGISARSVVADAFARTLSASGRFEHVRVLEQEPVGEDRRRADAIVRVAVPAWGLVGVRNGDPDLLSSFADVRAQMVVRGAGVTVWEDSQDVTNPERFPLKSFTHDREFAREELIGVLERAGRRLANELLYARSGGR